MLAQLKLLLRPVLARLSSASRQASNLSQVQLGCNDMAIGDSGSIDLITSKNHYRFNLAWMLQRADPPPC